MKILAVSDRVMEQLYRPDVATLYPGIDLIIGCGDLPYYYLEFLASALDAYVVFVHGNHDQGAQYTADGRKLTSVQGGVDLHATTIYHDNLILAGLEGSMRYRPGAIYMYSEWEMRLQIARLVPRLIWNHRRFGRALDILVTHSPPLGIHDRPDLAHTGFGVFLWLLRRFKPRLMLHGHIHAFRRDLPRITKYGDTLVVNVYPYRLLDLSMLPTPDAVISPQR